MILNLNDFFWETVFFCKFKFVYLTKENMEFVKLEFVLNEHILQSVMIHQKFIRQLPKCYQRVIKRLSESYQKVSRKLPNKYQKLQKVSKIINKINRNVLKVTRNLHAWVPHVKKKFTNTVLFGLFFLKNSHKMTRKVNQNSDWADFFNDGLITVRNKWTQIFK